MKRGLLVLLAAVVLGLAATFAVSRFSHQASLEDWFCKKFDLPMAQAQEAAAIHRQYQTSCAETCRRIAAADERLKTLIQANSAMTPEIRAAIAETDTIRTECRTHMMDYFYQVAAKLPPDKRQSYLDMVLPTVLEPEGMRH